MEEKFRDLKYEFQDVFKKIPNNKRKLLFSIQDICLIDLINDESSVYKELNLFNDAIFLIPSNSTRVTFCGLTTFRDLPNLKYFKNLVQIINADKYLTIQFKKDKQKQLFMDALAKTDVSSKVNDFIEVTMLGTENR